MSADHQGSGRGSPPVPPGVDIGRPSAARVYDCLIGGRHHFPADRVAAREVAQRWPGAAAAACAQRRFLRRAVRYLLDRGVDQFLDLGSGIPATGAAHELAAAANPGARTVYVDNDPAVVAQARMLLRGRPTAEVVLGDVRRLDRVLTAPDVSRMLDLNRPVAVLCCYVLHHLADEEHPAGVLAAVRQAVAPGSALVFSHCTLDAVPRLQADAAVAAYRRSVAPIHPRRHAALLHWLRGWVLVPPGLVPLADWRPDPADGAPARAERTGYGAVGLAVSRPAPCG